MSHHGTNGTGGETFSVILRVYGSDIHLWPYNETKSIGRSQTFKIYCHDRETRSDDPDIQVFVLPDTNAILDKCAFKYQKTGGQSITSSDLAIFMAAPVESTKKASYAIDLSIARPGTNLENSNQQLDYVKVGAVYLYLDPQFSSQGVQRMQIISAHNMKPIGQMQVEYLVIKNPHAFGVSVPRPKWLSPYIQLDAGHRGAGSGCRADLPGAITENTVASFNYAFRHGADMCELDVMCTKDGVPVVYHNYTLDTSKPGSTQIDELTLDELRNLQNISIHDKNCKHNLDTSPNSLENKSCRPYPTLEEVLQDVDKSCALNIELKWPQLLPNGKSEAIHYREINDSVDRILRCINDHCNDRAILFSTLNADIAIMLRLKQSKFPVLFLTTGDHTRFNDPITKSTKNAIHFALAFDMAGINPNVAHLDADLVRYAQDRGLLVYGWGRIESAQAIKDLRKTGINGLIYDKIDLIKPKV